MSGYNRFDWRDSAPKKPPPARGIRMKKAGSTWWGKLWLAALESVLGGDASRLARGRTYARAGRTHDLSVTAGEVTASVTGSRDTPYRVTIQLAQLSAEAWKTAIDGLARKAQFSAELLAGEMPQAIDDVFVEAGAGLFPRKRADLETSCSCPDWGDPCKHVAATYYVLGEALDRDPFLLFELRGRTKDQVLAALRAARVDHAESASHGGEPGAEPNDGSVQAPTVMLGDVSANDYDRPRAPLPSLHFTFEEPTTRGAVLRQLGAPVAWEGEVAPADLLAPLVRAAAEAARRIATAEPGDRPSPPPPPPKTRRAPKSARKKAPR